MMSEAQTPSDSVSNSDVEQQLILLQMQLQLQGNNFQLMETQVQQLMSHDEEQQTEIQQQEAEIQQLHNQLLTVIKECETFVHLLEHPTQQPGKATINFSYSGRCHFRLGDIKHHVEN